MAYEFGQQTFLPPPNYSQFNDPAGSPLRGNWWGTPQFNNTSNDPILQNYNYLMQNYTANDAWDYLFKNWTFVKDKFSPGGIWEQLTSKYGENGAHQLVNQYAASGHTKSYDPQSLPVPQSQIRQNNLLENMRKRGVDPTTSSNARILERLGLTGAASNPAAAAGGNNANATTPLGDYTYSRYDDGMDHLGQINDPLWKSFGNPNRGPETMYGPGSPAQQASPAVYAQTAAQTNPAQLGPVQQSTQPAIAPTQQTASNNLFGSRSGSGFLSGGSTSLTPPPIPTAPQVPQAGTEGTIAPAPTTATATPTTSSYTINPSRYSSWTNWGR